MSNQVFKKESFKQLVSYFLLCCLLFNSQMPARLFADACSCIEDPCSCIEDPCSCTADSCSCMLVNQQDARRARIANIVTGATIVALVGGVAYAAFGSSGHRHHSSHNSSSYSNNSDNHYSHHSHHSSSRHSDDSYASNHNSEYSPSSYYSSNPYSIFSENDASSFSGNSSQPFTNPQFLDRGSVPFLDEGNLPARARKVPYTKDSKSSNQLSGVFISHSSLSTPNQGSFRAFVQLPDGTLEVLGNISFSNSASSSLSYGPFTQKGSYAFGICVDEGTELSRQVKVGLEINMNGSTVQNAEFFVPAHPPINYESNFYYFDLL